MPQYRYTAKDEHGRTVRGTALAPGSGALYTQLRAQGLYLTRQWETDGVQTRNHPLKTAHVADFCRSLGTMLAAGVPMARAFAILREEEGLDPYRKGLYDAIRNDLRRGVPLSDALESQAPAFPPLLTSMIRSAEGTGQVDRSALRMADHYEKERKLDEEVGNSLLYPLILIVLIFVVTGVLMVFVVPQFAEIFAEMESLPLPTVLLLGLSDFLQAHWPGVLAAMALGALLLGIIARTKAVRLRLDRRQLHRPITGKLRRRVCTARFARTLSNLYSSGVPILLCLEAARGTVGNTWIAGQFDGVLAKVRAGRSLSEALAQVDGFERKLAASILVGEETGRLDEMLASLSGTMDDEAEAATKKLMTLIEPVMVVALAVIICAVMVAVILPIYQSYGILGGPA